MIIAGQQIPRVGTVGLTLLTSTLLFMAGVADGTAIARASSHGLAVLPTAGYAAGDYAAGDYIVQLAADPAVDYGGSIDEYPETRVDESGDQLDADATDVRRYSEFLEQQQSAIAAEYGFTAGFHYSLTFDGFSASLSAGQAKALAADDRIAKLVPDALLEVTEMATPNTVSNGLGDSSGIGGVWQELGGADAAGAGVVIGVIDTGIAPENPLFAGQPLSVSLEGPDPSWERTAEPSIIRFPKNDGGEFTGSCADGDEFDQRDCSSKIIGARYFLLPELQGKLDKRDYLSPRTPTPGHGAHVASIAAGLAQVPDTDTNAEPISGIAPAAKIAVYKACWTLVDLGERCPTTSVLAAVDAAVRDGVDVINFSLSSGRDSGEVLSAAMEGAAQAGVFISASAGNDGQAPNTFSSNIAPWITTVGNHRAPDLSATLTLTLAQKSSQTTQSVVGLSLSAPRTFPAVPFILASAAGSESANDPEAKNCAPDSLDPSLVHGSMVLCVVPVRNGVVASGAERRAMSAEVQRAGGVAVVLANEVAAPLTIDVHSLPAIRISADALEAISTSLSIDGVTATGEISDTAVKTSMNPTSHLGPETSATADVLKPEVAAVGTLQRGAGANARGESPTFRTTSGTSQAAAVVSGLAALYLTQNPKAGPAEIKSALMTTAHTLTPADGSEVFSEGAGAVTGSAFLHPGLIFQNDAEDWRRFAAQYAPDLNGSITLPFSPSELNLPSIQVGSLLGMQTVTRQVTSTEAGSWTPTVSTMPGVTATVSPQTLVFAERNATKQFSVTFSRTTGPYGTFSAGYLSWTNSVSHTIARIPLAVRPMEGLENGPPELTSADATGSVTIPIRASFSQSVVPNAYRLIEGTAMTPLAPAEWVSRPNGGLSVEASYPVTLTSQARFARFVVKSEAKSESGDRTLSLSLWRGDTRLARATTEGLSKTLDLSRLPKGDYIVRVAAEATTEPFAWGVTQYVSDQRKGVPLTVTPRVTHLAGGQQASVTAQWKGLAAGSSYLGLVDFLASSGQSLISVTVPPQPRIETISPATGPTTGGNSVLISGDGFNESSVITIDGTTATGVVAAANGKSLAFSAPAHPEGVVDISVSTADKTATIVDPYAIGVVTVTLVEAYTYSDADISDEGKQ